MKNNIMFVVLMTLNVSLTFWLAFTLHPQVGIRDLSTLTFMAAVCGWILGLFVAYKVRVRVNERIIHQEGDRVLKQVRDALRDERERDPRSLDWLKRGDDDGPESKA